MKTIRYEAECPGNIGDWKGRHKSAVHRGLTQTTSSRHPALGGMEHLHCIVQGLNAWCQYAAVHQARFESPIGQDYVLGDMWKSWGFALRGLLNGETGDLDCGTLDAIIVGNILEQFPEENI